MNKVWRKWLSWMQAFWRSLASRLKGRSSSPTAWTPPIQPGPARPELQAALGPCVSVVIPALNEAKRIADVVRFALTDSCTAEVIVVDDSSTDNTAHLARQAGARVITSTMLGKGQSMADGTQAAQQALLVFLDGDLAGLRPGIISELARPLAQDRADFVKARFGRGGGRVTELTAKPMIKVFFPELARFNQPLGGVIAARRALLLQLEFEQGYGVDIGLLIDASRSGARLAEVDIGHLEHDSQPLHDLTAMANEVSRVIYSRAKDAGRLHVDQITAMYEAQRQATASWQYIMTRQRGRTRLMLLDMDGTVTSSRYVVDLARCTGAADLLASLLDKNPGDAATRSAKIASLFRFVHHRQFEKVAMQLPLRAGVVECVKELKRAGFMVGLVSDSYFVAADIVRKRIFADFALAHTVQFEAGVCTGELRLNEAFSPPEDSASDEGLSKGHVLSRFRDPLLGTPFKEVWAVGDNDNDADMLRQADQAFIIEPQSHALKLIAGVQEIQDFHAITDLLKAQSEDQPHQEVA